LKEFTTSARAAEEARIGLPVTVKVDDREITFSPATESEMAMLLAASSPTGNTVEAIADTINFFFALVEDEDQHSYLRGRLFDRGDPFDVSDIADIVVYLVEEWTARPTSSPSDSTPSRRSAGRRSTARPRSAA